MEQISTKKYSFTSYFYKVFKDRVGQPLNEENKKSILNFCNAMKPHRKIDDKKRMSEYFTMRLNGELITIICDALTHKIITVVKETHVEHFKGI